MKKHRPISAQEALGDITSTISNLLGTAGNVVSDPYLGETICHIQQLGQIKHGQPVQVCPQVPPGRPGGVGLDRIQYPLRAYVYAQQNPWVYPVAIGAVIGIPFLLGYLAGKS